MPRSPAPSKVPHILRSGGPGGLGVGQQGARGPALGQARVGSLLAGSGPATHRTAAYLPRSGCERAAVLNTALAAVTRTQDRLFFGWVASRRVGSVRILGTGGWVRRES